MVLCNIRVPVVGNDGTPRMPTKASRASRWIAKGKAIVKWSKLGLFYVQLTQDVGCHTQDIGLGLDPGSKYDGIAIVSNKEVLQTGMTELPQGITKKLEQRRNQRRNRRYRDRLARVGGYMNGKISLHTVGLKNKRFTQRADPKKCIRLYNQKIMHASIPPTL